MDCETIGLPPETSPPKPKTGHNYQTCKSLQNNLTINQMSKTIVGNFDGSSPSVPIFSDGTIDAVHGSKI